MKLTKDILSLTRKMIVDNETGKINDTKQITEKETALYFSDLIIIEKCIKNFVDIKGDNNSENNSLNSIKEVVDLLNSLKNSCYDIINVLTTDVTSAFISEFNCLSFNNYKTFQGKEYNSYIKKITPLKKVYDNMGNAFLEEDIKKIFIQVFDNIFNQFKQSVINKGIIEKDDQLKQFRGEINYLKKVFKLFTIIDCAKYKEILDEISIKVNPNKIPKKKKKAKQEKEEKEEKEEDNAD
jgi:hypothetical protein